MKIFGVTGWKNAGKTGLMERLVREITTRGISVSTVKHAHHSFDVDHPGKDSARHREAGAREVLLSSRNRWALMSELRGEDEEVLSDLLARLSPVDLVLIEGYKRDRHPKIEAYRAATKHPLISTEDDSIVAVASDVALAESVMPVFDLDDTVGIADFVLQQVGLSVSQAKPTKAEMPLKNDCFALPSGVDWTPVDKALAHLRENLGRCVGIETLPLSDSLGKVLAEDQIARRSNPPAPNSAVDGYGFTHTALLGKQSHELPLVDGRAAAGSPYSGEVPLGQAVRILTGAILPKGVDTVVLQEDVTVVGSNITFEGSVKAGSNTRKAGEDVKQGDVAIGAGHVLRPPDLALLSALGIDKVSVFEALCVGVISTGDELVPPGSTEDVASTYDANRPMLLSLAERWGYQPVDLGHVGDNRALLRDALDAAAQKCDVILTSGGASAGDEDHMSALLKEAGGLQMWRIAMKPGRPLALGLWQGVPVFGLPGNPVAAFVCALVFARPACAVLSGAAWQDPVGFDVPASFEKKKKAGRREYLRARITDTGQAEVFASEGSGRISGLTWADGLVELEDGARHVKPGDLVRFIPYGAFGL